MKTAYKYLAIPAAVMLCLSGCNRVDETESDFNNVLYIEDAAVNSTKNVPVSVKDDVLEQTIQSSLALPTDRDVNVTYKVDLSLVDRYNAVNGTNCEPLPADNFELSSHSSVITAGNVRSAKDTVRFRNLKTMPNKTYILPVTLESEDGIDVLSGSKTLYFRVKKGALIVKAANITDTYLQFIDNAATTNLNGLSQVTFEGFINPHGWGTDANISTVMGIEEYFMIRLGDASWPAEQLQFAQLASFGGKWPPPDNNKRLKKDVWTHFAFTFDLISREMRIYINGKVQSRDTRPGTGTTVDLSPTSGHPFYIGRSIGYARGFIGEICEFRIWSVARTPAEIVACMYGEGVTTGMPGLSAWWRFDEGEGNYIYDQSGNGNHIIAGPQEDGTVNPLRWIDVELGGDNDE